MSLFETTQKLEQLSVPRDDAHQQTVPGRANVYSRPHFSKGFDYSKWDDIASDDEDKPLSPAKFAPQSAPVPTRAAPPARRFDSVDDAIVRNRAADGWGRDGVQEVAEALGLPKDDPARRSVDALQTSLAQAGAIEQAAALPFVVGCEPDPASIEKVRDAYERRKATPMAGETGARKAAETVARSEAKKVAKIARCLLREPDGAQRLLATGAVPSGVRGLGKYRDAPALTLATAAVNAMEKKAAERLVRDAIDGPLRREAEFLRHTPFQTELSRTAFKVDKGVDAIKALRAKGFCILEGALSHEDCDAVHAFYDRPKPETELPIELGLQSVRALAPQLFGNFGQKQPEPEAQMAFRAAVQVVVGCAHELETRAPELRDGLAIPPSVTATSQQVEQVVVREPLWRDDDPDDDTELVAYCFANPRDWDDDVDGGMLIVRDDNEVAHYLPATGGSVVLILARGRDVEFKAPKKRHSVVLKCRYDRRRSDVDVEDEDEESDEEETTAEQRAASLAAKLRARATAGGESGGTWGASGFRSDGQAVDSSATFDGSERNVDLV